MSDHKEGISQPESALVGFGQTGKFELVFGTNIGTRKAQNLLKNNKVAVVIGHDDNGTVQYEGTARKLEGAEAEKYSELYYQKVPSARRHKGKPGECYFLISPAWLRFTEVKVKPWKITELNF